MNRTWTSICILSAACLASSTAAQVEVKILDYTDHVYSYEPVFVVFEVLNQGSTGVAVPGDGCSGLGVVLELGSSGQELYDPFPTYDCWPDRLIWLEPGERWLFLQSAAPGAQGKFDFQAVLRSQGKCGGRPVGPNRLRVQERDKEEQYPHAQYDCWNGEVRSERVSVVVDVPDSAVDHAAAELLELNHPRWNNSWKHGLIALADKLFTRFPTSHYTYAAYRANGNDLIMLNVVLLQPENPLNPWVAGAMAAALAHRDRPCAPTYEELAGTPPDLSERYRRVIAAHSPPKALQDYLRQQALEYSNEECPKRAEGGDGTDAQSPE